MEVIPEPVTPPASEGWLGGGIAVACFWIKLESEPLLAAWAPGWGRLGASIPSASPLFVVVCEAMLSEESSLCKGEE